MNVGKSGGFLAGLFQAAVGSDGLGRFPRRRHFHSWLAVSCVAANQVWTKGDRERLVQMFMHCDSAAGQRRS